MPAQAHDYMRMDLNDRQMALIEGLANGLPYSKVADISGYTERQVTRLAQRIDVKKRVAILEQTRWNQRTRRAAQLFSPMIATLKELLGPSNAPFVRLGAASQLKSIVFHMREIDLQDQVNKLQEQLESLAEQQSESSFSDS